MPWLFLWAQTDGTIHLHTRTTRYGKLEKGLLVTVRPSLIRRAKQHLINLPPPASCDMVVGNKGYIWLSRPLGGGGGHGLGVVTTREERERLARVRNALVGLNHAGLSIWAETVMRLVRLSLDVGMMAAKELAA